MNLNILMVDDHPPIIEGYKAILSYKDFGYSITTTAAHSCKDAYNVVTAGKDQIMFDLVFIDITLPSYPEKNLNSGQDLILLIQKQLPNAKIVVLTSHTESFLLYTIIKECKPNGLLIKNDVSAEEFLTAFSSIMNGNTYYSKTVLDLNLNIANKTNYLDNYNRQIIILLSQGIKTKNLGELLFLSNSSIEKRKVIIKTFLGIEKGNDEDLIREARKKGLI